MEFLFCYKNLSNFFEGKNSCFETKNRFRIKLKRTILQHSYAQEDPFLCFFDLWEDFQGEFL